MKLNLIQKQLNKYGTILLNSDQSIISKKDFQGIEKYLYMLPTENVVIGDAGEKNQDDVARLMTDIKKPNLVNKNISKKVINILNTKYLSCFIYILNKPKGYICSSNDPKERKKVIDLIPIAVRLFNIGRLDYNSTGIILLTNNGDIANQLLHPSNEIIKRYYVESKKRLARNNIKIIEEGLLLPDLGEIKANIKI